VPADASDDPVPTASPAPVPTGGAASDANTVGGRADVTLFPFLRPPQSSDEAGRLGGYRVLRVLGGGGMGVVFVAEDLKLNRRVALKVMQPDTAANPNGRKRFLREARAVAALQHDHIVPIYTVDEDNDIPFLIMPLLSGETLEKRLEREVKLPVAEVLRIGREMAEGLAAAHAAGLIHRDVKPANVWLEEGAGRVKLLDFGLARAAEEQQTKLTKEGGMLVTPAYMAPEQAGGEVDQRADLFSLGAVLYEAATGQQAFGGGSVYAILARIAAVTPPPPRTVNPTMPQALSDVIVGLLAKRPDKRRPQSARETALLLRTLETAPAGSGVLAPVPSQPAPAAADLSSRWLWLTVLLAAGGIAALLVLALLVAGLIQVFKAM
jgi:serine/threonine protein kinase